MATAALIAFVVLAIGDIASTSPTADELPHLAAGYTYLTLHDFRMNDEHPPLMKELAGLSIVNQRLWPASKPGTLVTSSRLDNAWRSAVDAPTAEWIVAHELFYGRRDEFAEASTTERIPRTAFVNDSEALFTRARKTMLVLPLLLGIVIFAWAGEVWGWWGGALSVMLFAFDPNFIAHGGLVTTDVGVTALMAAAIYLFWRCSRRASIVNMAAFAMFFALATIAKFSALLLIPMVAVLFLHRRRRQMAMAIGCAAVATVVVIWAAYGFRYRATAENPRPMVMVVDEWYAARSLLVQYPDGPPEAAIQRARPTVHVGMLGRAVLTAYDLHVLPEAYLYGLALTERNVYARWSFLRGEGSHTGFPSYFFWTFLYKTPEASIAAIVIALLTIRRRRTSAMPFLLWPIVVYMAVSMASSLNIGHRHILPIYPFLYVIAGSLYRPTRAAIAAVAIVAIALPSFVVLGIPPAPMWGRHLSFMNAISGGPWRGYEKLIDSNFDWGQDLKRLGEWAHDRPAINLVYFGTADPRFYGIAYHNLVYGYGMDPAVPPDPTSRDFVISASVLQGVNADVEAARHYWQSYLAHHHARLVDHAGYSILIWKLGS